MTDAEIKQNVNGVMGIIEGCTSPTVSEKVKYTWASMCAQWCQEIADEMQRRIKGVKE